MNARLKVDNFDLTKRAVRKGVEKGLRAAGFALQEEAMANIQANEQIDTGAMLNGIYVASKNDSDRESVAADALQRAAAQGKTAQLADEETTPGELQVKVAECMEYGVYQELLHAPYLAPAAETIRGELDDIVARAVRDELK